MKKSDVKIGMKVVPFRKTKRYHYNLNKSVEWEKGKERGYLYVVDWDTDEKAWVLSYRWRNNPYKVGDFFNSSDFNPYEG